MRKLRKDDEVVVIAGRDKGARGGILRMVGSDKVIVAGINMVKRHTRANPNQGKPGGIIEKEAPLHISNVAIFNPDTETADRVGIRIEEDGSKTRFFKSSGEIIE